MFFAGKKAYLKRKASLDSIEEQEECKEATFVESAKRQKLARYSSCEEVDDDELNHSLCSIEGLDFDEEEEGM